MQHALSILVPGRDRRSVYTAEALRSYGCQVEDCPVAQADIIVLPMGVRAPKELLSELRPGQKVLGGRLGADRVMMENCGVTVFDYYDDIRLKYANALPTAEGAIGILIERLPVTIQGTTGLIIGYGRIGTVLSQKLAVLGSQVCATARRESDLGRITAAGLHAERTGHYRLPLSRYDFVVNTVPAPVFSAEHYGLLRPDCLLLELASDPGGFDEGLLRANRLLCVHAPGLPGRCAAKTAGYAIAAAIVRILELEEPS